MDVKHVGHAELLGCLKHCAAVEAKTLGVVGVVAFASAVQLGPRKHLGAIYKVVLHAIALTAVHDSGEAVVMLKRNRDGADGALQLARNVLPHARIEGQIDRDFMAQLDEFRVPVRLRRRPVLRSWQTARTLRLQKLSSSNYSPAVLKGKVYYACARSSKGLCYPTLPAKNTG